MTFGKQLAELALATMAFGSTAFALESTLATGLASHSSSGGRIMAGRDIVVLAKEDIDAYRTSGEASDFLKETVARLAKLNRTSETDVWNELKK